MKKLVLVGLGLLILSSCSFNANQNDYDAIYERLNELEEKNNKQSDEINRLSERMSIMEEYYSKISTLEADYTKLYENLSFIYSNNILYQT